MVISICDDDPIGRGMLTKMIEKYRQKRQISDLEILTYQSPAALAKDLGKKESDVYLLDIMFPDGNGIDLAKEIRLHYHHNPIVFISSSPKHMLHAFNVYALRYFVKPVHSRELFETLDYALENMKVNGPSYYQINTTEGKQQICFSNIMYIERKDQTILITTNSGKVYESVTLRESFASKVQPLLDDHRFMQTHVSYLVNIDAIDTYQRDQMIMQDGRSIPISRSFASGVKEKYKCYFC